MKKNASQPNDHTDESDTSTDTTSTDDGTQPEQPKEEPIIVVETLDSFYKSFTAKDYIIDGVVVLLIAVFLALLLGFKQWILFIILAIMIIIANLGAFVWSWIALKKKYGKFWTKRTVLNMMIPGSSFITVAKFYKVL